MKTISIRRLIWSEILIWVVILLLALFVMECTGCALLQPCPVDAPASRMVDDYRAFRDDGQIDEAETKVLDNDAGYVEDALDEKSKGFMPPTTGIPWLDAGLGLAGLLLTAAGTHKYTMKKRDKTSPERVKKALEKTA